MSRYLSSIHSFLKRKECPYFQFLKYVMCGGVSVLVDQVTFYVLAWRVWPCLGIMDPVAKVLLRAGVALVEVAESDRQRNYWLAKIACFIVSNAVVYLLNVLFVFRGGRHRRSLEILLFFGFSFVQVLNIWFGSVLIGRFGWEVTYANLLTLVLGAITNYCARKKIIFNG